MAAGAPDKPHDRADVDDRSAAGLRHLLGGELGAEEYAGLVDRDDAVPALDAVGAADRAARYAGIVHQDVQPAIGRHRLGDQAAPLYLAGDVYFRGDRLAASCADVAGYHLGVISQDVGNHDLGALRGEKPRLGFAHAMSTAGDDRNLVFQTHD